MKNLRSLFREKSVVSLVSTMLLLLAGFSPCYADDTIATDAGRLDETVAQELEKMRSEMERLKSALGTLRSYAHWMEDATSTRTAEDKPERTLVSPGFSNDVLPWTTDWEIELYSIQQAFEPFVPMLKNILPQGSMLTVDEQHKSLAVLTSVDGHARVSDFIAQYQDMSQESKPSGQAIGLRGKPENILLEILLLEGEQVDKGTSIVHLSDEAKAMGLIDEDLVFMGQRNWRTVGKGIVQVSMNNSFSSILGGGEIRCDLFEGSESKIGMEIFLDYKVETNNIRQFTKLQTKTELEPDQTTIVASSDFSVPEDMQDFYSDCPGLGHPAKKAAVERVPLPVRSLLLVIRANYESKGGLNLAELNTVVQDLAISNARVADFLQALAKQAKPLNFVADPDVGGSITLKVSNITVREVLDLVCRMYGWDYSVGPGKTVRFKAQTVR